MLCPIESLSCEKSLGCCHVSVRQRKSILNQLTFVRKLMRPKLMTSVLGRRELEFADLGKLASAL